MGHNLEPIRALDADGIRRRRLAALDELQAVAEAELVDAEDLAAGYERARKAQAARLSREDADAARAKIEVIVWGRLLIEREGAAERAAA